LEEVVAAVTTTTLSYIVAIGREGTPLGYAGRGVRYLSFLFGEGGG
jgi:hypothetical protein